MAVEKQKDILVYDVSGASEQELAEMKENVRILADIVVQEAYALLNEGKFFGCYHDHLEIALSAYRADYPCEDCDAELPSESSRH